MQLDQYFKDKYIIGISKLFGTIISRQYQLCDTVSNTTQKHDISLLITL